MKKHEQMPRVREVERKRQPRARGSAPQAAVSISGRVESVPTFFSGRAPTSM